MTRVETADWVAIEEHVAAFEEAYARDGFATIAEYLPPAGHPLRSRVLGELVRVELELSRSKGRPRGLDEYRADYPELFEDPELLAEIAYEDYRVRRQAGERPDRSEYARRYRIDVEDWVTGGRTPFSNGGEQSDEDTNHASGEEQADRPSLLGGDAPKAKKPRTPFPEAGTTWFGFELLGELGRGAFSQVYLARQDDLAGRLVALKVSREAWVESQRLAQLQHSHIMPVYSVHKLGDFHAVVMPYLGSTTLADVLSGLRRQVAPPHSGNYFAATVEARDLATNGHLEASPDDETLTPYAEESVRNVPLVVSPQNSAPRTKRITRGGNGSTIRNGGSDHDSTLGGGNDPRSGRAMRKVRSAAAQAGRGAGWLGLGDLSYVDAVLWMGVRLADGLAHAHERGIVHCDLKPANVLLSEDGQPLLLDFNLAADTKIRNDADERIGGTLPYMAPEQMTRLLDGKGDVDHRSDIYSLGVMLYELLTGQAAFPQHEGPWREVVQRLRDERQAPPGLNRRSSGDSPAVEAIIRRCLEPDVSRRYQSAEELREDLERQLNHLPLVHAGNPSWGELVSKWLQRHPRATSGGTVALAAALVLSVAAGAAWSFDRQRQRLVSVEQARTTLEELREATQLLSDPGLDSERRATLEEICQRVANRYGISTDRRWRDSALVMDLDASQRRELLESLGETFVLWQHAQAAEAVRRTSSPEEERAALRAAELWNLRAETCFAPGGVPQFINLQRAQLQARLSGSPPSGPQSARDAAGSSQSSNGQSIGERENEASGDVGSKSNESASPRDKALRGVGEDSTAARDSLVGAGSPDARDRFLSAVADMHRRRFADATRTLESLTKERPNDARYWTVLGHCKLQQGGLSEAVHCYTVAIALWPRAEWLYFNRGTARLEQKQFDAAEQDFDAVLELQPHSSAALINRALARFGARRFEGAIADLDEAARFDKAPTRLYFIRSRVKQAAGDSAGAQADLSEGLQRQPTDDSSWVARGLARLARDPQGAMNDFDAALALNPACRAALEDKAHVLSERLDQIEESVACLDRAIELYPDYAMAWAGRGVLKARQGSYDEARADARKALGLDTSPGIVYQVSGIFARCAAESPADRAQALKLLGRALRDGFGLNLVDRDPEWAGLRTDEEYVRIVEAARTLGSR